MSEFERNIRIIDILMDLRLTGCKNSLIKMLSGGEKRRLSLATEVRVFKKHFKETQ